MSDNEQKPMTTHTSMSEQEIEALEARCDVLKEGPVWTTRSDWARLLYTIRHLQASLDEVRAERDDARFERDVYKRNLEQLGAEHRRSMEGAKVIIEYLTEGKLPPSPEPEQQAGDAE